MWRGNLLDGNSGVEQNGGIVITSINFTFDGSIWRPDKKLFENNIAATAMPEVNIDIDLHVRPLTNRHIGCDQIDASPFKKVLNENWMWVFN